MLRKEQRPILADLSVGVYSTDPTRLRALTKFAEPAFTTVGQYCRRRYASRVRTMPKPPPRKLTQREVLLGIAVMVSYVVFMATT